MPETNQIVCEAPRSSSLLREVRKTLARVPLYEAAVRESLARVPDRDSSDSFGDWLLQFPFLTKQGIRRGFPENFLPPESDLDQLVEQGLIELEHTSGTSQDRVPLLLPAAWWDEQEARALRQNAYVANVLDAPRAGRRVTIAAPTCTSKACRNGWTPQAERIVGNTLFVGTSRHPFLWSPTELQAMVEETLDWCPGFLDVDPVYGVLFARYCQRHGVQIPSLRFILCSYEFVSTVHRQYLEQVFGVPVFNLYGSTETGHLLMEDARGRMKPVRETAWLEVVDRNARGVGDLVVTTLTNPWMPLLRYWIGDVVRVCSSEGETSYEVLGRRQDRLSLPSGRVVDVAQIDACFNGVGGVLHYHLRQRTGHRFVLRFVGDDGGLADIDRTRLGERLRSVLDDPTELIVEPIEFLISQFSGKFRLVSPA